MLTDVQLAIVAIIATAIVWVIKLAKADIHSGWLTAGVYVVSLVVAWLFAPAALPVPPAWGGDLSVFLPALIAWLGQLLVPLSAFVGFATLVYNALLKAVMDKYLKPMLLRRRSA